MYSSKRINFVTILILILFSLVIASSFDFIQYAVDGGLVLEKKIIFPNNYNILNYYYLNSWTALHQIVQILIKFGFNIYQISFLFLFLNTFILGISIFLILSVFNAKYQYNIFFTIIFLLLAKNFGDTEYPTLFYSEHSYGLISLSLSTLIIALVFNNFINHAIFLSILLISVHPIIGCWMVLLLLILLILNKDIIKNKKKFLIYFFLSLIIILISFLFFLNTSDFIKEYDVTSYSIYMSMWDGHRYSEKIHYEYLFKGLILFLAILFFKKINKKQKFFGLEFILIIIFCSYFLYFLGQFDFIRLIFPSIIFSRFVLTFSIVGWPIILGIVIYFLNKKRFGLVFAVLLFTSIQANQIIKTINQYYEDYSNVSYKFDEASSLEKSDIPSFANRNDGYIVTTASLERIIFSKLEQPLLLYLSSFDMIPYHKYLSLNLKNILEEIYQVNFTSPPIKNNPSLSDEVIFDKLNAISLDKWNFLFKKYNIKAVIVPSNFDLKLDLIKEIKKIKIYTIN